MSARHSLMRVGTLPSTSGADRSNATTETRVTAPAPWTYPGNDLVLGFDEAGRAVILSYQDRAHHVFIPGRTGVGKSRLFGSAIRQDIANHSETGCAVIVFDLHGEVVQSTIHAAACDVRFKDLPIVVIDFTDRDGVIRWNPLRRHAEVDPAVSARRLVEAITHADGGLDPAQKPTLFRTMTTYFHVGIERKLTLTKLLDLADPEARALRSEIARAIDDERTRADLERMNGLTRSRFEDEMLAFINRVSGLTSTAYMRAMMSAADGGFSFDWALTEGAIVLVNLATSGGNLTETDARRLSSLMLTELWQAAQSRGKGAAGERRPCYVYIDEAPFIATPTIALGLAQARGFGLHFTIAAQATSQFEDFGGDLGRAIKKAVLRDTLTKIVMAQTAEEDDITPLARELALAYYDPHLRKHTATSFQVVGEEREEYWTISKTLMEGRTTGRSTAVAHSTQRSTSSHWATSTSSGGGFGTSYTQSTSDGIVSPEMLAAETHPSRTSHVDSEGYAESEQSQWSEGEVEGGSEQEGEAHTSATGKSMQQSLSTGVTHQEHVRWRPLIEERESGVQFFSFDEQLRMWEKRLFTLYKRHALVSRQGMLAVEIATPTIHDPDYVDPDWVEDLLRHLRATHGFWVSLEEARETESATDDPGLMITGLSSYGRRSGAPRTNTQKEDI